MNSANRAVILAESKTRHVDIIIIKPMWLKYKRRFLKVFGFFNDNFTQSSKNYCCKVGLTIPPMMEKKKVLMDIEDFLASKGANVIVKVV
jgi:hypothetical protein